MLVINSGRTPSPAHFPKPLAFEQIVNPGGTLTKEKRVRILDRCILRGREVFPGSVFALDVAHNEGYEDYGRLISSTHAVGVPLDTPLVTMPAPKPETQVVPPKPLTLSEEIAQIIAKHARGK